DRRRPGIREVAELRPNPISVATALTARQEFVEVAAGQAGNDVCGALTGRYLVQLHDPRRLVRLHERNQLRQALSVRTGRIDLLVGLVIRRVVLRDTTVDDAEVGQD